MAYGKIKADTLVYDNSGSDVETSISSLAAKADLANPAFTGTATAVNLTLSGNLQVNGTTTTVASSTMTVADKNIELAKGAANDAAADGGGITLESGDGNKTITWTNATDSWDFNQNINVTSGEIKILGAEGSSAQIHLYSDEGDDNEDKWRLTKEAGNHSFRIQNYSTGSWVTGLTLDQSNNATFAGSVTDDKGDVRQIPRNAQSSAYVLAASDVGKAISISSGGVTLNTSTFGSGDAVTIVNNSGSDQTITQGSGVTLYNTADASTGNRTLAGRGMATIWCGGGTDFYISGAGLS